MNQDDIISFRDTLADITFDYVFEGRTASLYLNYTVGK
jgi:hypothetical protein